MSFKSTKNRTHLRIVREVEAIGGNVLASGAPPARHAARCALAASAPPSWWLTHLTAQGQ
jgi:hypothetical protein